MVRKKLTPGTIRKTSSLQFKRPAPKPSIYEPIFNKMKRLKAGQSFTVPVPKGTRPQVVHNRLTAAFQRFDGRPPRGCWFRKRTTEDGNVAIYCERKPK